MSRSYNEVMEDCLNNPNIYKISTNELKEYQNEMIRMCFEHHYNNCEDYRKYCDAKGITPSDIQSLGDAHRVPLIDSYNTLRNREFFSVPQDEIVERFSSSGTTGKSVVSVSLDKITLDWTFRANLRGFMDVMDLKTGKTLLMLPDLPQMAFSIIFKNALPTVGHEVFFGLKAIPQEGERPKIVPDMDTIQEFIESESDVKNIVGFPFTVAQLKDMADAKGLKIDLGENGLIMTAGGWKAKDPTGKYSDLSREEIEKLMSDTFGVLKHRIRDTYGTTESSSGYVECCHEKDGKMIKRKHVPFWMYQLVLDPDTLEPVPLGEEGIGAFLDFKCYSYPCFVIGDDIIKLVSNDGCECGRPGQVIEYVARVKEYGQRGCAFTVQDKLFSEEYLKAGPTGELVEEKEEVKEEPGVMSFAQKGNPELEGAEISANIGDTARAMEAILEVLNILKADESINESLAIVNLGKHLCFKKGIPTIMKEEELLTSTPDVDQDKAKEIIDRLMHADLMVREEHDGKVTYQVTKKADELGEAMFPMFIWALKWAKKEES